MKQAHIYIMGDNMDEIELIKREIRNKEKKEPVMKNKWYSFLTKIMILGILFLGILIYSKTSDENKMVLYNKIFGSNFSFASINKWYQKYLGNVLPFKEIVKNVEPVFNETLEYNGSSIYKDGVQLTVASSYLVPINDDGIVIYVGEKEEYGNTVIIQQSNGIDVWYGNVTNLNVGLYDYVEKGSLLGESKDTKLYLVFKKDGKVVDYKTYLK